MLTLLFWVGFGMSPLESPVIENGPKPAGKAKTLVLTEDLRLGPEDGDEEYFWTGPDARVHPTRDGKMFVLDDGNNRILLFDKEGKFLKQIGRPGAGPGEFDGLRSMMWLEKDGLVAFEFLLNAGSVHYFDAEFAFQKEEGLNNFGERLDTAKFAYNGRWLFGTNATFEADRGAVVHRSFLMNNRFERVHEVLKYERAPFNGQRATDQDYWREYLAEAISTFAKGLSAYGAFARDGTIYTAVASKYEVSVWDQEGKKIRVFKREYKPITQTDEEVRAIVDPLFEDVQSQLPGQLRSLFTPGVAADAVEMANFPPVKNPIFGLVTMDNGMVLVIHDRSWIERTETADIFDGEGRFLGSYKHPAIGLSFMEFLNGYAYTMEDVDDEKYLVRYKVSIQ